MSRVHEHATPLLERRMHAALASRGTSGDPIYNAARAKAHAMSLTGRVLEFGAGTGTLITQLVADGCACTFTGADLLPRPAGIPGDIEDEIIELENSGVIESYYDIVENHHSHKVGGYPTFCQSGIDFGDNFDFVLQISSDEKSAFKYCRQWNNLSC